MTYQKKLILLLFAVGVACSDDPTLPPDRNVTEVEVSAPAPHLWIGETLQLTATPLDGEGEEVEGIPIAWSSRNGSVIRVSATGLVTGLTEGAAVVRATAAGRTGEVELLVLPEPVSMVILNPSGTVAIAAGETLALEAMAFGESSNELPGRVASWSSSAEDVASVDEEGVVLGRSEGLAWITVNIEGVSAEVEVRVGATAVPVASVVISPLEVEVEAGSTVALQARAFAADGQELFNRPVTWSSGDDAVAAVAIDGVVTGVHGGTTWVGADSEGVTAQAQVTVREWRSGTLATVGGAGLPVVWRNVAHVDSAGVELTRTIKIVAGSLRVDIGTIRYEQEITLELWEQEYVLVDGSPVFWGVRRVEARTFHDSGTAQPVFEGSGTLIFRSDVLPLQSFTGFATPGGWEVTERINGSGDPLLLVFLRE